MTNEEFIKNISLENEIWKDVVGWEGLYIVSNLGRIATLKHTISYIGDYDGCKIKKTFNTKQCLRKIFIDRQGYAVITLRYGKRVKLLKVHRVVAEAFIPNPNNFEQVNHKDENKSNNCVDNLEWCTCKYNSNYGTRNIRIKKSVSNAHKNGLFIDSKKNSRKAIVGISIVDKSVLYFEKSSELHHFGFERHTVSKCCRNLKENYKGYKWMWRSDYENLINKSKNS